MRELLEIGKKGIFAGQRSLDVTGQNIANANTPGYTRQRANLIPVDYKRNGQSIGSGVQVSQVQQLRDTFVDAQIREKDADLGEFNEKIKVFEQLEVLLASGTDADLDKIITNFFNSFSELSNNPESLALRENVLIEAQNLTNRFNELDSEIQNITENLVSETKASINKINQLTADIAKLNEQIATASASGQPDNNSLDIRNQKLTELSQLAEVNTIFENNGSVEVRLGNMVVIQHNNAVTLSPEVDPSNNLLRIRIDGGRTIRSVGGRLGASIDLYENIIPEYENRLNTLAKNLVEKVNQLHVNGYALDNTNGNQFFDPTKTTAANISIDATIINSPNKIAASDTINAPGNNTVARQIFALLDDSNAVEEQSFIQYSLAIAANTGFTLSGLRTNVESSESVKLMLENQQNETVGVNMDEELANMIKFQNAYQASARVIATAQEMYDTILSLV